MALATFFMTVLSSGVALLVGVLCIVTGRFMAHGEGIKGMWMFIVATIFFAFSLLIQILPRLQS